MIHGLAEIVVAADFRFGQEDGIGDDRGIDQMIAMQGDELLYGGLIALRSAVAAQPSLLHVRGFDVERIAHPLSSGESAKRMRSVSRRVRTAIHPNHPMSL